jgi:hypothetical protein
MDDCTFHRNHLHRHGGTPAAEGNDDDELDLEKALLCRRHRPAVSSPSLDLDSATLHKKTLCTYDDLQEEGSAEDPTCEMSLSTMETESYGLEGLQLPQQHQPPRYGGRHSYSRYEPDGSSSFTELAFASMDMDRHGGPLRGDINNNTTEHSRYRHNRYASSNNSYPSNDRHNDSSSYCDGMGESMFGESFALDDGSPSFDVEAHQQQKRAAASSLQASRSQLLTCSVVDEE